MSSKLSGEKLKANRQVVLEAVRQNRCALQVYSTPAAFAALKANGSLVTWGVPQWGGDSSLLQAQLADEVTQLCSTYYAFAALKTHGSFVTWDHPHLRGDSTRVHAQLADGATQVYSSHHAFAALKANSIQQTSQLEVLPCRS